MRKSELAAIAKRLIKQAGGPAVVAREMRVLPQSIQYWIKAGIPPKHVVRMSALTGTPCAEIRPDIFNS